MGRFDLYLQDAQGFKDADFLKAQEEGVLKEILGGLPLEREVRVENTLTHMYPVALYRRAFTGFPNAAYPMDRTLNSVFHNITLMDWASEPYYGYWYANNNYLNAMPGQVSSTASKYFVSQDIELATEVEAGGREAVFLRERWLYLPSEAVSSNIRTLGVYCSEQISTSTYHKGLLAWARLKDAGGHPIALSKSSSQSLLVQYTVSFVAL